ncbi:hypothetical protein FLAVO9AF_10205 [Flavobacterium sp. 9AF]|uniref:hypothetical protein n=1 Tax=Flavobacterium sp. 9AF TaxID=2653142 RepID=UPI0012F3ED4C|nr:hypothetical protein [Flavobacterium sp. 9AF]VXA98190.1 hypothetical protein FLAVO9AF_10205 [Flavobacterium sp. 9AF]
MKKQIVKGIIISFLVLSLPSCEKEFEDNATTTAKAEEPLARVQNQNGILIFSDYDELEAVNARLASLPFDQLDIWENQNNFLSLASIDRKINEAEVQHQETFFKGLNPDLTVAEYQSLGYRYEHTAIYKNYLNKGTIVRNIETDGSISTELAVKNHGYLNVLNFEGKVIVGNELVWFADDGTFVYKKNSTNLLRKSSIDTHVASKLNGQYNFNKGTGNSSNRWITDPAKGSNYRYYGKVIFTSSFTVSSLSQNFYWEARAEQKKFGNWNTRNNYNPIWGCAANWSYDYWIIYPGAGFGTVRDGSMYPLPNSSGKPTSPYYVSNLNTNYTVRSLQFSSMYTIVPASIGYSFFDNVRVYNYNFVFKYSGGASGYNYTAY